MVRGTFANVRLRNRLAPGTEGGVTRLLPEGEPISIFDASVKYAERGTPLMILAGKEYGSGSSRDWAAKGPLLLGVKAVIAESYERIHRSNLVGMGILPLQFESGQSAESLRNDTGEEVFDLPGIAQLLREKFSGGRTLTVESGRSGAEEDARVQSSPCVSTHRRRFSTTRTEASCSMCCGSLPRKGDLPSRQTPLLTPLLTPASTACWGPRFAAIVVAYAPHVRCVEAERDGSGSV